MAEPLHAQQSARAPAWVFTYMVRGVISAGRGDTSAVVFDVTIWRGVARIVVRSGPLRNLTGERGAMLLRASDSALIVLNPSRQDALVAQSGELNTLLAGPAGGAQLTVSDVSSATTSAKSGPRVEGVATRRIELKQRYTLQLTAGTVRRAAQTEQRLALDISRAVSRLDPAFTLFGERFILSLGSPAQVRQALRVLERNLPQGFPMTNHAVTLSVSAGDTLRAESRGAVSGLRRESVDTMLFVVPSGYRVTEMSRLLQRRSP